jgi:Fur family ferric uptake transcriptional regulator
VELHVIDKLSFDDGFARYELGRSLGSEGHHHHHAICLGCKAVISLEEDLLERLGFAVTDHEVKLYGYCRACRKKSACAGKKEHSL